MELRQLQYMLKVAEEGSFSKAAQQLYISQPSLSQCIQRIEQRFGLQLFDRATTPLSLTYAGEVFVENARRMLNLNHQFQSQMQEIIDFKKGRLTIGVSNIRGSILFPNVLPLFCRKFPGIEVIHRDGTLAELEDFAIRGVTDLSLINLPLNKPHFISEPLFTENIVLIAPRSHPLNKPAGTRPPWPQIHVAGLREEPFLLLKKGRKMRELADQCFINAGFNPRIVFESDNYETILSLVKAGLGITFGLDVLALFRVPDQLAFCTFAEPLPSRTFAAVYCKERHLSRAAREFIALTKDILAANDNVG
ncbi:LysR family transcriptional regulator [Sporomusa termitida]|uniref:HTH-type transcriptional regulator CynR n=1 Tax=Sporomusa termitida TaxID=2377 RepID=A0A517DV53_9FIRM|nr:LysR family transcriptional regulator [Sporomusa termitida]QDR81231.1 HTH-type transcriptional regulator CynR [Sporomusa termitida]